MIGRAGLEAEIDADSGREPLCASSWAGGVQEPYAVEVPYSNAASPAPPSVSVLPSSVAEAWLTAVAAGDGYVTTALPPDGVVDGIVSGRQGEEAARPVAEVAAVPPASAERRRRGGSAGGGR